MNKYYFEKWVRKKEKNLKRNRKREKESKKDWEIDRVWESVRDREKEEMI